MTNLVFSEKFGRLIRLDPAAELGIPTQLLIERAIDDGARDEALALLAYMRQESEILNATVLGGWLASLLAYLRGRLDVADLGLVLRVPGEAVWKGFEFLAQGRYDEAEAALGAGQAGEARTAIDGMRRAYKTVNDLVVAWVQDILTVLADRYGPDEPARAMRPAYEQIWRDRYRLWPRLTPEEQLALSAEGMRAHFGGPTRRGEFVVKDEGDRYTMYFDPCGTGGILRRGDPESGAGPYPTTGINVEARPWTWGKTGVHWYCTHCSLYLETFAAEDHGYPLRPLSHNLDPQAPCAWHIYKDPTRTRVEHFTAIGVVPPASFPVLGRS